MLINVAFVILSEYTMALMFTFFFPKYFLVQKMSAAIISILVIFFPQSLISSILKIRHLYNSTDY